MSNVYTLPHRRRPNVINAAYAPLASVTDIHGAWGLF